MTRNARMTKTPRMTKSIAIAATLMAGALPASAPVAAQTAGPVAAQAAPPLVPAMRSVPSAGADPGQRPSLATLHSRDLGAALRILMEWWPGQFDNHEQIVRQSGGGLSLTTDSPFHRVHTEVRAIGAPDLGPNVLAITRFAANDPARIERREIAIPVVDGEANAIRVRRFTVADWGRLADPASAARLRPADLAPLGDGCDLLLRFAGEQFGGELAAGTCATQNAAAAAGAKSPLRSAYELIVAKDHLWERAETRRARGGAVTWEMAPGSGYDWYQQTRARPYTCNVFASTNGEMAKSAYLQTIHLHDQGGEAEIAWPDGRTLVFTIHTRAFTATPERAYPLFRIHEKGNPVPIAYAYAVDRNTRFGLNLGWFYVRCYDDADIAPVDMLEAHK
jgi:hypothetical protein